MPEGNVTINAVFELTSDSTIPGVSEPIEIPDPTGNGTTTEAGETTEWDDASASAENGGNDWLWFLLGGLVIVVAGGGFAVILIKKKTKFR